MTDKQPLLDRMRKRAPSSQNQTCTCAGDRQCDACLIAEAVLALERMNFERRFARRLMWSHVNPVPKNFKERALLKITEQLNPDHLHIVNVNNEYTSAILWLL